MQAAHRQLTNGDIEVLNGKAKGGTGTVQKEEADSMRKVALELATIATMAGEFVDDPKHHVAGSTKGEKRQIHAGLFHMAPVISAGPQAEARYRVGLDREKWRTRALAVAVESDLSNSELVMNFKNTKTRITPRGIGENGFFNLFLHGEGSRDFPVVFKRIADNLVRIEVDESGVVTAAELDFVAAEVKAAEAVKAKVLKDGGSEEEADKQAATVKTDVGKAVAEIMTYFKTDASNYIEKIGGLFVTGADRAVKDYLLGTEKDDGQCKVPMTFAGLLIVKVRIGIHWVHAQLLRRLLRLSGCLLQVFRGCTGMTWADVMHKMTEIVDAELAKTDGKLPTQFPDREVPSVLKLMLWAELGGKVSLRC